ncbi:MAG: molybdopterin-guanine dinucleotide biosynthesis protein MobB [Spirochaetaceae bacterium]
MSVLAIIVSIVGYGKSGKTAFAESLIRRVVAEGLTVAAIKTGRLSHGDRDRELFRAAQPTVPDSRRLSLAGADPVLLWTEEGIAIEGERDRKSPTPLPGREEFAKGWQEALPRALLEGILSRDLILLEGRPVPGAMTIQMRNMETGAVKYPSEERHLTLAGPEDFDGAKEQVLNALKGAVKNAG